MLTVLLLLQAGGLLLFYEAEQLYAHHEMQQSLKKCNRSTLLLTVSLDEYREGRIGKDELRLRGKMYDIRSGKVAGDKVVLTVVRDRKEEEALRKIAQIAGGQKTDNNTIPKSLVELLSFVYLIPEPYTIGIVVFPPDVSFTNVNVSFHSRYPAIVAPPPKSVSGFA